MLKIPIWLIVKKFTHKKPDSYSALASSVVRVGQPDGNTNSISINSPLPPDQEGTNQLDPHELVL